MSGWDDEQEESPSTRRSYSPAEAAADLAFYIKMRRAAVLGTLLVDALPAILLAIWYPRFGLALAVGGVAGIANTLLSMHGNERLLERRNVAAFVLSSFVRIGLFGIVPVVLAVRAPSFWTLALYFAGFFTPLAVTVGLNCKRR
ncbi:MAG TPA: hypothetical protein VJP85_14135 [Candidatus Baltobacteraceae bacterium]|nr:hypothetical protein [Candidatus Baltobacteraceae bacterium]